MTASGWLGFAASPSFAVMAVIGAVHGADRMAMLCGVAPDASPIDGMTAMYALMSLFHAAPWINLAGIRRRRIRFDRQGSEGPLKTR
ncbi:hypothetical protein [Sphingomonas sp. MMS24-J13]|uniref:hypothetical protein n=1 Tax=Sphingomonas sp. MMS24-J13 TaxID=3238686 RepID=UPI00384F1244